MFYCSHLCVYKVHSIVMKSHTCKRSSDNNSQHLEEAAVIVGEMEAPATSQRDVLIDVAALGKSIANKLCSWTTNNGEATRTIPRVPERIRLGENDPYEPLVISIGPYHRGKKMLQPMEAHKWQCLKQMLSRSQHGFEDYISAILELSVKARSCYSEEEEEEKIKFKDVKARSCHSEEEEEKMKLKGEDFVEMMLLDGCFISEFIQEKYAFNLEWMKSLVSCDMLLLENQIPFFVVEKIFELSATNEENKAPFTNLALKFCHTMSMRNVGCKAEEKKIIPPHPIYHLLHLYHAYLTFMPLPQENDLKTSSPNPTPQYRSKGVDLLPSVITCFQNYSPIQKKENSRGSNSNGKQYEFAVATIPTAAALHDSGIKFKKKENCASLIDVTFKDGIMEIPPLLIRYSSNSEFRNLIAFEQFYPDSAAVYQFSGYVEFMDYIVNNSTDVGLLHKKDIIQHFLGSDEGVAELFNRLSSGVVLHREHYLYGMYDEVNKYCKRKTHQWRASLVRNYFSSPWSVLSLVAAFILLFLTFVQTLCSVYTCS